MGKIRVLGASIQPGDYITTNKPTDVWWRVETVETDYLRPPMGTPVYRFQIINAGGYRKELVDWGATSQRKFYRWTPDEEG